MNVRKFIAATAREALHKVKELLGPDAIILSNRAIPGGVEIMAVSAGDMDMLAPLPPKQAPQFNNDYTVRLSSQMASMPELSATATPTQQPSVKQPPLQSKLPPLAPRPAPKWPPDLPADSMR